MNLEKVGKFLAKERKRQGKTLQYISDVTRVSLLRLKEVESGYLDDKLAQVHVQGYIKSYAKCLNIDEHQLLRLLNSGDSQEKKNLKLIEPKKIDKSLTPFFNVTNISMGFAICMFAGLIVWARFVIDKYDIQSAERELETIQRNLSQISLESNQFCRDNSLPSYLKSSCVEEPLEREEE